MRDGAFLSAGLHAIVISVAVVGVPALFTTEPSELSPIVVEVINLVEDATPPPRPEPPQTAKTEIEPPPAPPPPVETPPPAPPVLALAEPAPPEVEPVPPKPEPEPPPVAEPKPPPEPKAKPPVDVAKAVPRPRRKPKPPLDAFQTLLRNLDQERKQALNQPQPRNTAGVPQVRVESSQTKEHQMSPIDRRRLIATLAQLVMQQVSPCWSIPAGSKDAHTMQVGVRIFLNPDGTLSGPPQVEDTQRMNSDPAFRAVAESALRALRHPRCIPLRLPHKHYDTWRAVTFNFDPRELLR